MSDPVDDALDLAQLLSEINDAINKIAAAERGLARLADKLDDAGDAGIPKGLGEWHELRNRLVPLDAAIMAVHLISARVTFQEIPKIIRAELFKAGKTATQILSGLGSLFSTVVRIINFIVIGLDVTLELISADQFGQKIRDAGYLVRGDLSSHAILRGHRVRRTRRVFTRAYSPPQRRPNKNWRNPPSP